MAYPVARGFAASIRRNPSIQESRDSARHTKPKVHVVWELRIAARACRWSIPLGAKGLGHCRIQGFKGPRWESTEEFHPLYLCLDCSLVFFFFIAIAKRSSILASALATAPIVGTVKCRARRTVTVSGLQTVTIVIIVRCQEFMNCTKSNT